MCRRPITLKDEKIDGKVNTVPCGSCPECLQRKRSEWSIRLEQELKHASSAWFVTVTYSDKHLPSMCDGELIRGRNPHYHATLYKKDAQNWLKRLRKISKTKIRYYLVGEYGEKHHRPHFHILLFNLSHSKDIVHSLIEKSWSMGSVYIGTVTPASIAYVTNYVVQKGRVNEFVEKPFALMSRRPGIGAQYLDTHGKYHKANSERMYVTSEDGIKRNLPRYYRDRLYSQSEKRTHAVRSKIRNEKKFNKQKSDFERLKPNQDFLKRDYEQFKDKERKINRSLKSSKL